MERKLAAESYRGAGSTSIHLDPGWKTCPAVDLRGSAPRSIFDNLSVPWLSGRSSRM